MATLLSIIQKTALAAAYGLLIFAGFWHVLPKYEKFRGLQKKHAAMEKTLEERRQAIRALKRNQERMRSDDDFVVMILHENNQIRDNEIKYIIKEPGEP